MSNLESGKWRLRTLGAAHVEDALGRVLALPTAKCLELVALLALGVSRRAELAATLWPGSCREAAAASLRQALSSVRKALPGCLETHGASIKVAAGSLDCDLSQDSVSELAFLPGSDSEWVIDFRLAMRERTVDWLLSECRRLQAESHTQAARELARRAVALDPHSQMAAEVLSRLLAASGELGEATKALDRHRRTLVKELGVLPSANPSAGAAAHPVMIAAEWLLDRNPKEALSLINATRSVWERMAITDSAPVLDKVLALTSPGKDWNRAKASQLYLRWISGDFKPYLREALSLRQEAVKDSDWEVVARLSTALAYGYLSAGEFRAAERMAEEGLAASQKSGIATEIAEGWQQVGVIYSQTGRLQKATNTFKECDAVVESTEDAMLIAGQRSVKHWCSLREGRPDRAIEMLAYAERVFTEFRADRMLPWVHMGLAEVAFYLGDHVGVLKSLDRVEALGEGVGGQAATALVYDNRAKSYCALGAYAESAENWLRAAQYRKSKGSTRSLAEKASMRATRETLRTRLSPGDWKLAHARIQAV